MIGRAAKGNPFLFRNILSESKRLLTENKTDTGEMTGNTSKYKNRISIQELKETILRHARLMVEYKGEYIAIRQMRSHLCWYTQGLPGSAAIRRKACEMESLSQLEDLVTQLYSP